MINFGDGTGYLGPTGVSRKVPQKQGKIPILFGNDTDTSAPPWRYLGSNYSFGFKSVRDLPARVLLANFFPADANNHTAAKSRSRFDIPCGNSCSLIKEYNSRCDCSDITQA
jgi:hypothetical protein